MLGAFAKLRKATVNLVMSVCVSIRIEQLGLSWGCIRLTSYTPMLHAVSRVLQLLLPTSYAMKKYMTNASLEGKTATKMADFAT